MCVGTIITREDLFIMFIKKKKKKKSFFIFLFLCLFRSLMRLDTSTVGEKPRQLGASKWDNVKKSGN